MSIIAIAGGDSSIDDIPAKLERLKTIEWDPDHKPSVMRMVYILLEMDVQVQDRMEQGLTRMKKIDCSRMPGKPAINARMQLAERRIIRIS